MRINKFLKVSIVSGAALILLAIIFFLLSAGSGKVPRGSFVRSVSLGGMTTEEAVSALSDIKMNPAAVAVIDTGFGKISLAAGEVGAYYDAAKTVDNIMRAKRGITATIFGTKKVYNPAVGLDDSMLDNAISVKLIGIEYNEEAAYYTVDGDGVTVTNAKSGRRLDREKAKVAVIHALENPGSAAEVLEPEIIPAPTLDVDSFLAGMNSEAQDPAYYRAEDGTIQVSEAKAGIEVEVEAAKTEIAANTAEGESYRISAEVKMPSHTAEEMQALLFRDVLATYSSSYASSGQNRASNIALAASKVNGVILMPGETFSFNNALGERTVANGYKEAHAYAAGQVIDQVGGGICQVSSTLYNSALLSNLQIDSRRSHQMTVSYVPLGRDATVDWGTQDFKFTNNTGYPIKLTARASGGKLETGVVGTKTDNTLSIKIETETISEIEPTVETEEDPTLPKGTKKRVKTGSKGYVVDAYRVVYQNGVEVSREKLTRSRYNPTKTIEKVGTMQVAEEQPSNAAA